MVLRGLVGSDGVKRGQVGVMWGQVGSSGVITGQLRVVAYSCAVYLQPMFLCVVLSLHQSQNTYHNICIQKA